ncbi:hypothetical protein TUM17577_51260 [Enterobacter asburiae]|nr:hypothetical protein TUM17577_51260 [Enterobacter asburiae]
MNAKGITLGQCSFRFATILPITFGKVVSPPIIAAKKNAKFA